MANSKILQFKIELLDIKPPIWRRVQLYSTSTFWELHCAIQNSIGWEDCHLHCFEIKNPINGKFVRIGKPIEKGDPWGVDEHTLRAYKSNPLTLELLRTTGVAPKNDGQNMHASWKAPLLKYFSPKFAHYETEYTYDFGDLWIHRVIFEGIFDAEPGKSYPVCIDGQQAGPPEDCCGPLAFEQLKVNLKKNPGQRTEEEKEKMEWLVTTMRKPNYDPEFFDPSRVTFMNPADWLKQRKENSIYKETPYQKMKREYPAYYK